jgi:RNA-directed DNA polymerase
MPYWMAKLLRLLSDTTLLANFEVWVRWRLRSYLWQQWGNGKNRFRKLRRRGVSGLKAAVAAGLPSGAWRMSGHPAVSGALRNHYLDPFGLSRLCVRSCLTQSNRHGTRLVCRLAWEEAP